MNNSRELSRQLLMNKDAIIGLVVLGSLWGISEVLLDLLFKTVRIIPRSIILTAIAVLILSAGRIWFSLRGGSVLMGIVASFYKFLNSPFFPCMISAVIILGCTFELMWRLFINENDLKPFGSFNGNENMAGVFTQGPWNWKFRFGMTGSLSIWFAALTTFFIYQLIDKTYGLAFGIGYLSHLFSDGLTKAGINYMHPITTLRTQGFIETGTISEKIAFVVAVVIAVFLFLNI